MSSDKCTNKGCNPEKKPEVCSGSTGFFGRLFGGGESNTSPDTSGRCVDCGLDKCNCNCALREHLKQCCGYGTLPKLIDSCDAVNPPKKKAVADDCVPSGGANKAGGGSCSFPTPDLKCSGTTGEQAANKNQTSKCLDEGNSGAGGKGGAPINPKCPPMPCTDVTGCIPTWMCPPVKSGVPTYSAPSGVEILPISVGGRNKGNGGTGSNKCGECGTETKGEARRAPKVSKDCPMVRPRCGEPVAEQKQGFFARILSFFGFGKK